MASSTAPFEVDLVRLVHGDLNPDGPGLKIEEIARSVASVDDPVVRRVLTGSYMVVDDRGLLGGSGGLRVEGWLYPTVPERGAQGIVGRRSERAGWSLGIG